MLNTDPNTVWFTDPDALLMMLIRGNLEVRKLDVDWTFSGNTLYTPVYLALNHWSWETEAFPYLDTVMNCEVFLK